MTAIEVWNLELPALPERSRFYHLEPIGVGTPYAESLTSYITRLAEAHCVSPKALVIRELLPMFGRLSLSELNPSIHFLWRRDAVTINGTSTYAGEWVRALESLTCRSDLTFLTMLTWKRVIDRRRLLRATQAWCPDCLGEWRRNNSCLYIPLLWSLKAVTVCPRHRVRLSTHCPHEGCLRALPLLSLNSRPGCCSYCGHQLDSDPGSLKVNNEASENGDDLECQCWKAKAIGELIEAAPSLSVPPHRAKLASSITQCSDQLAEGSLRLLARRLGIAHSAILAWQQQVTIPFLETLLQLSYGLGISPRLLVIEADEDYSKITSIKPAKRSKRKPIGDDELRKELEACLLEEPPPSLKEVATRLGYCQELYLYSRFSELSSAIKARYRNEHKSTRPRIAKARTKLALDELRAYLQEVLMGDETPLPSIREIAKRIGYRGESPIFRRAPDLCVAIAKKRREQLSDQPLRQALEVALVSDEYPPPSIREIAERLRCSVERLYNLYPQICHALVTRYKGVFDTDAIRRELEAALADTSLPPPSVRTVAKRVGFGEVRLRRHFPELCSQISLRYQTYRKNRGVARRQHIWDEVKSAVVQLSVEGCYPSLNKVRQLLQGKNLSFVDVTKARREVLRELHIDEEE
jgi:transcriptional regulator with XRE-family HTH domain